MENQHEKIKGYRNLSAEEIALMNEIKAAGEQLGTLVRRLRGHAYHGLDGVGGQVLTTADVRWLSIGETHLQQGLMALNRAVAKQTTF